MDAGGNALIVAGAASGAAADPFAPPEVTMASIMGNLQTFANQKDTAVEKLQTKLRLQETTLANQLLEISCHKRTIDRTSKEATNMVMCILFMPA